MTNRHASHIGDGQCDPQCNTPACNYDGGDCALSDVCPSECIGKNGDGNCYLHCHSPACHFDGGDCLQCGNFIANPTSKSLQYGCVPRHEVLTPYDEYLPSGTIQLGTVANVSFPWFFLPSTDVEQGNAICKRLCYCFASALSDCGYTSSPSTLYSTSQWVYSYSPLEPTFTYTWNVPSSIQEIYPEPTVPGTALASNLRLVDTSGSVAVTEGGFVSGGVEVFHDGVWGTVCDDDFDNQDAQVVCRQLGFSVAGSESSYYTEGQGTETMWLDDMACSGSDNSIESCGHSGWGNHNCDHNEDVGVTC